MTRKISVACMGSRERYSMPVALHKINLLEKLFTDIYMPSWIASRTPKAKMPSALRALLSRNHAELPISKVSSQYAMGLDFRIKVRNARTLFEKQELSLNYGRIFSSKVARSIRNENMLVGFTGESLETFQICKERGIKIILDQVDAGLYEWDVMAHANSKYLDWEFVNTGARWSQNFEKRVKAELDLADEIIVNSQYSKDAMAYWGISKKITILPIASSVKRVERVNIRKGVLRVLFIGLLSLRKGIRIALEAIDRLVKRGFEIELVLVGESIIKPEKMNTFKGWKYMGPLPNADIPKVIDSCDVLLFPTYSDGFGMVQVEAISRGMPVISTKNSAQIIENNISGFLVEIGSVDEVVTCLERYCVDRELLQKHSINAFERSSRFTSTEYTKLIKEKFYL